MGMASIAYGAVTETAPYQVSGLTDRPGIQLPMCLVSQPHNGEPFPQRIERKEVRLCFFLGIHTHVRVSPWAGSRHVRVLSENTPPGTVVPHLGGYYVVQSAIESPGKTRLSRTSSLLAEKA